MRSLEVSKVYFRFYDVDSPVISSMSTSFVEQTPFFFMDTTKLSKTKYNLLTL